MLDLALAAVEHHAAGRASKLVFLGDYIDRGDDSRGVVERLMALQREKGAICLKGNHEQLAVQAHYFDCWEHWLDAGGEETLISYAGPMPADHLAWLDGLPHHFTDGLRHFVHAGLDPDHPERFDGPECLWVRERFLQAPAASFHPWHIVHGHTPEWSGKPIASMPEVMAHRTNLDTGAYWTGTLAIGVFAGDRGGPNEVILVGRGQASPPQ